MNRFLSGRAVRVLLSASCALVAVVMLLVALRGGTVFSESLVGFHLAPTKYLERLLRGWDSKIFLGVENGAAQFAIPEAFVFATLERVGFQPGVAQRIVFAIQLSAIAAAMAFFCRALRLMGRFGPLTPLAVLFYLLNLYVPFTLQNNSIFLWPYCAQPLMLGITIVGFKRKTPVVSGLLLGAASLVLTGVNLTFVAITLVTVTMLTCTLIASERFSLRALRRAAAMLGIGLAAAFVLNAYWTIPYVYHIKTTWIAGYFSETLDWHSAAANVPDLLRLLGDPLFFGSDDRTGANYTYSALYGSGTPYTILGFIIVACTLAPLLSRRFRRLLPVRFALLLLVLSVVMASGGHIAEDGGGWLARPYAFLYAHSLSFQVFRGLNKWQSISALSLAVLFGYAGVWLRLALVRVAARPLRAVVAFLVPAALVILSFTPVAYRGIFRGDQAIDGIPPYWKQFANHLAQSSGGRVAIFPRLFSPAYFWGSTGGDFPSLALDHATVYQLAFGSGLQSSDQAFAMDAIDRGIETSASWAPDLLRRLGVSNVVEQEDSAYGVREQYRAPLVQNALLKTVAGERSRSMRFGDLVSYSLAASQDRVVRQREILTDVQGYDLFRLLALLEPDEVAVSPQADRELRGGRVVTGAGTFDPLALSLSEPLASGDMTTAPFHFALRQTSNVRIYSQSLSPQARPDDVTIDDRPFRLFPSLEWRLVTTGQLAAGGHNIANDDSVTSKSPSSDTWRFKIVDETEYMRHLRAAAAIRPDVFFPRLASPLRLPHSIVGRYTLYAVANDFVERDATMRVSFGRSMLLRKRSACYNSAAFLSDQAAARTAQYPPSWWYASDAYRPLTEGGWLYPQWAASEGAVRVYNPFDAAAEATIAARIAPVGASRRLVLQTDPATQVTFEAPPRVSNSALFAPSNGYFAFGIGQPQNVTLRVALREAGWNRIPFAVESESELPIAELGGFIDAAILDDMTAEVCSTTHRVLSEPGAAGEPLPADDDVVTAIGGNRNIVDVPLIVPQVAASDHPVVTLYSDAKTAPVAYVEAQFQRGRLVERRYFPLLSAGRKEEYSARLYDAELLAGAAMHLTGAVLHVDTGNQLVLKFRRPSLGVDLVRTTRRRATTEQNDTSVTIVADGLKAGDQVTIPYGSRNDSGGEPTYRLTDERNRAIGDRIAVVEAGEPQLARNGAVSATFVVPPGVGAALDEDVPFAMSLQHGTQIFRQVLHAGYPGQFTFEGGRIVANALIGDIRDTSPWYLTYVPRAWDVQGRGEAERLLRIPISGRKDGSDLVIPPSGRVRLDFKRTQLQPYADRDSVWFGDAYVERILAADRGVEGTPVDLALNGRRVKFKQDARHRFVANVELRGDDRLESQNGRPATILLRRTQLGAVGRNVVVLNEGYHAGWTATVGGEKLEHVKVNGFANGFLTDREPSSIRFAFALDDILEWSRLTTLVGLGLLALLCVFTLARRPRVR